VWSGYSRGGIMTEIDWQSLPRAIECERVDSKEMYKNNKKRGDNMRVKRYWFRNWVDGQEYVTNAYSVEDLKRKVGIDRLQILKVWRRKNLNPNDPIILY
jgi:hypothetical protein